MSLPNFMCLGAAKSGTTTLFDILRQHPDVYIPAFKEPHFFDIPENYNNGIEWYERNYFRKADKRIIADFTPSYFFEKETPKRIFKGIGSEIKFVVLLRNPVDRAYSHYLHSVRDDHENLSFEESLKQENERLERYEKNGDYLSYLRNSYFHQGLYGEMSDSASFKVRSMISIINDMERIGDICYQMSISIERKRERKAEFTAESKKSIEGMLSEVQEALGIMNNNLTSEYSQVTLIEANNAEININNMRNKLRKSYLQKIEKGEMTIQIGMIYNNLVHSLEKIGDHIFNISEAIVGDK